MITTLGKQYIKEALPQKYKGWAQKLLTQGQQQKLMTQLAKQDPDQYIQILQKLNALAEKVISVYGKDTTITLDDVDSGAALKNTRSKLNQLIKKVINNPNLSSKQKQQKIIQLGYKYTAKMKDMGLQDAKDRKTGIANQIASKSRGNPVQLMQLLVGDMMMKDAMNRDIPYLATMPYVQGNSPMSYWASAMSGRKSVWDVQAATGRVGYLGKQTTNATHNTPVSIRDCGTTNTGLPVKAADPDNVGALLLRQWHGYKPNTPITQQMVAQADPQEQIIIRSPTTCKAHDGVCALCSGIQQTGKFPAIGSYVALNAAKTFIQPLTQSGISCLHPGTPVRMADWSVKAIKDIQVGDMVIGVSRQGILKPVKVTGTFNNGIQPVYLFLFSAKDTLHILLCTPEHKLLQLTKHKQSRADEINQLEAFTGNLNNKKYSTYTLLSKQFIGQMQTRDIQVDHPDHLFLLANGIICSNSKHGSGIGGVKVVDPQGQDQPTGFDSVQRMFFAQRNFPGGAILSQVDGRVTQIRKAPQGGYFISVNGNTVYSPVARTVKVKVGDVVQAGDMLTNGVPNPMQIVKYKGIGQGRKYFMETLADILPKTGAKTARRNLEQFSRAMINKVRITSDDGYAGYYPGQIANYDDIAQKWKPREDSKQVSIKDARGKYLQTPALYFSIGTKITPSVYNKLNKYGYDKITVNDNPPPFQAQFVTSRQYMASDKHWLPRLSGQRLKDSLFDAARKGITDPYDSASFVDKIIISPYDPTKINNN